MMPSRWTTARRRWVRDACAAQATRRARCGHASGDQAGVDSSGRQKAYVRPGVDDGDLVTVPASDRAVYRIQVMGLVTSIALELRRALSWAADQDAQNKAKRARPARSQVRPSSLLPRLDSNQQPSG